VTPRSVGEWLAVVPQILGVAILVFCVVFWAVTNRVEPLFVTTGGGLLALGQGAKALEELRKPIEPPKVKDPLPESGDVE
jgi:hypothetical protein